MTQNSTPPTSNVYRPCNTFGLHGQLEPHHARSDGKAKVKLSSKNAAGPTHLRPRASSQRLGRVGDSACLLLLLTLLLVMCRACMMSHGSEGKFRSAQAVPLWGGRRDCRFRLAGTSNRGSRYCVS